MNLELRGYVSSRGCNTFCAVLGEIVVGPRILGVTKVKGNFKLESL